MHRCGSQKVQSKTLSGLYERVLDGQRASPRRLPIVVAQRGTRGLSSRITMRGTRCGTVGVSVLAGYMFFPLWPVRSMGVAFWQLYMSMHT